MLIVFFSIEVVISKSKDLSDSFCAALCANRQKENCNVKFFVHIRCETISWEEKVVGCVRQK